MTVFDTNVLVSAFRKDAPRHAECLRSLELAAVRDWAICWPCVHEFLATVTRPRYFNPPSRIEKALEAVDNWLINPNLRLLGEGPDYFYILKELLIGGKIVGAAVHDARIAAICLSNKATELVTMDRDFARFPQLIIRGPGD